MNGTHYQKWNRLTRETLAQVKARLDAGESIRSVAKSFDIARGTVAAVRDGRHRLQRPPRPKVKRRKSPSPSANQLPAYLPTPEEIAAKCEEIRRKAPRRPLCLPRWRVPVHNVASLLAG